MTSAATRILRARGHFEVLGLPREQCTSAAVRAQFTKLVKEVHPDKCSHPDAAAAFRRLQAANDALKATGSRTRHLLREQRRPPDRPSAVAPLLETIGSTRVLAAAAGCLVLAEVCRIASSMRCAALCLAALLAAPTLAQDYSGLCATPANYQGGAAYDYQISPAVTCDEIMAHFTSSGNNLAGKDFSSALYCSAESYLVKETVNIVASYCCGTGDAASRRSACWADYSHVCATPANYQGGAMYDHEISQAITCDQAMDSFTTSGSNLAGKDFSSAFSCPAETYNVKGTVNIVATYCCGTGDAASRRSACWADYSHICADPTRWSPSAEWEAASASNGNTAVSCQQVMDYYTEDGKTLYGDDFSSASTAAESCTG